MAQKFLYGTSYVSLAPPVEWMSNGVDATTNDSFVEATINTNQFTFIGNAATFILNWRATTGKGVFNGIPFRIVYESNLDPADNYTVFDGYIDLSDPATELQSLDSPSRIMAPIVAIDNSKSVVEQMAVLTQGVLIKNGFLNSSHYVDCPVIRESKKNFVERSMVITGFATKCVTALLQISNNIVGALGNVLGVALIIGIIELALVFVNATIVINQLIDEGIKMRDLFFSQISYYKVVSLKTLLTQAFAYKGYPVEFGMIDTLLSNSYVMASQNEFDGYIMTGTPNTGPLKRQDWGYIISEAMEEVAKLANTRVDVRDGTVHIKAKKDPFWYTSPAYTPENVLIKSVEQYQNGIYKDDAESVKGTVMINYTYDMSDAHTLTEKSGDSYEIRRKLINEIDAKKNTLKGIDEVEMRWAMCVRKKAFDNLFELFNSAGGLFNQFLQGIKDDITNQIDELNASGVDVTAHIDFILASTGLDAFVQNRSGMLKIDDNSFAIPKLIYLTYHGSELGYRIPADFKNHIGAAAIYNNWYKWDSPADVSNFAGQKRLVENLTTRWSYTKFEQTLNNPFFVLSGKNSKFTNVNWIETKHQATCNFEINDPFDENITEESI